MRTVKVSKTYLAALHEQLVFGQTRYGDRIVDDKRARVSDTISKVLAKHPAIGVFDAALGLHFHPVSRTPFLLLYDFDEVELRIHLIVHRRADRSRLDRSQVDW